MSRGRFLHGRDRALPNGGLRRRSRGRRRFLDDGRARIQKHGHREQRHNNDKFFHNWSCSFTNHSSQMPQPDAFRPKFSAQDSGRERSCFVLERRRLDSRMRSFNARGRGRRCRLTFSRRATSMARCASRRFSNAASRRSRASFRLRACDRESWTVTLSPVGTWRSVTAVETLLTFWPPGPPERAKVSSRSDSRSTKSKVAKCSRVHSGKRAPSRPARSKTSPLVRRTFHPSASLGRRTRHGPG